MQEDKSEQNSNTHFPNLYFTYFRAECNFVRQWQSQILVGLYELCEISIGFIKILLFLNFSVFWCWDMNM
jgi:hypothetical protein